MSRARFTPHSHRLHARLRSTTLPAALALALGVSVAPIPATAQDSLDSLGPGTRVRVSSPSLGGGAIVGRFVAKNGDTLIFTPESSPSANVRVLLDERTDLKVSVARHNHAGHGVLVGASVGFLAGSLIVMRDQLDQGLENLFTDVGHGLVGATPPPHKDEVSSAPILVGLAVGAGVGVLVGATIKTDRWVTKDRSQAALQMSSFRGGPRLAVALRF
jgi:hypothetical protein